MLSQRFRSNDYIYQYFSKMLLSVRKENVNNCGMDISPEDINEYCDWI